MDLLSFLHIIVLKYFLVEMIKRKYCCEEGEDDTVTEIGQRRKSISGRCDQFFNFLVMFLFIIFLFISSGIDLGCNDSFFTTSGEHSAQNLLAVSNGVSDFLVVKMSRATMWTLA